MKTYLNGYREDGDTCTRLWPRCPFQCTHDGLQRAIDWVTLENFGNPLRSHNRDDGRLCNYEDLLGRTESEGD